MPLSSEYSRGYNPNKLNNNPNNNNSNNSNNNNPNNPNTNPISNRDRDRDGSGKYYKDDKQRYGGNRRYGSSSYQQNNHPHHSSHSSYSSYPPYLQNSSYSSNGSSSNGANASSGSNSNARETSNPSSGSASNTASYAQQGTINPFSSRRQNSHQDQSQESTAANTTGNQSQSSQSNSQRDSIHGHYRRQSSETNINNNNISNNNNSNIPSYGSNSYKGSYGASGYRNSHPSEYYNSNIDNNSSLNNTNNNNSNTTTNNSKRPNFRSRNSSLSLSNPEINPAQLSNNTNTNNSSTNIATNSSNDLNNINGQSSRDLYKDDSSSVHSSSNPSSQNSSYYNPPSSYPNRRHLSYGKERGYHDPNSNNPHSYSKRSGDIIGGSSNNKSGDLISSPPNSLKDQRYRSHSRDYGYLSGNRQPRPHENYYNGPNQQQPQPQPQQQPQKSPQLSFEGSPSYGSISQPSNINNNSRKSSNTKDDDKFLKSRHNSYEYSNSNKINPFNNSNQTSEKRNLNLKDEEDLFPLKSSANSKSNRPSVSPSATVKPITTATASSSSSSKTDYKNTEEKDEKSSLEKPIQVKDEEKKDEEKKDEETMQHDEIKKHEEKTVETKKNNNIGSKIYGNSSPSPLTAIAPSGSATPHPVDSTKTKMNDKDMELQKALIDSSDDNDSNEAEAEAEIEVETENINSAEVSQKPESELSQVEKNGTKTNSETDLNTDIHIKQETNIKPDTIVTEQDKNLIEKNVDDNNDSKDESPEEIDKQNLAEPLKLSSETETTSEISNENENIVENIPSSIESKDEIEDIKMNTEETTESADINIDHKDTDMKLEPSVKSEENIKISETVDNDKIKTGEQENIDSTSTVSKDSVEELQEEPDEPMEVIDSCIFPLNRVESKLWDLKHHSKIKIHKELKYLTKTKFTELTQYDFYKSNLIIFKQIDAPILIKKLLEQDELVDAKKQVLIEEYVSRSRIYERRKQIMNKQVESLHKTAEDKKAEETKEQQKQPTSRRSRHHGDSVRTEAEFMEILASLERERENDPLVRAQYGAAIIPDMIIDPVEKFGTVRNLDSNNIRLDKIKWAERIKTDPIDTFTEAEHEKFCEAFALFPKRFGKISSYIGGLRTPEECVLHYYRTKKETNFKQIVASRNRRTTRKAAANRRKHVTRGKQGITTNTTSGTVTPAPQDETNDTKSEVENTATADNSSKTTTPEVEDGITSTNARGNKRKRSADSAVKTNKKKQESTAKASTESPPVSESATEEDSLAEKSHIKDDLSANISKQSSNEKAPVTLEPAKRKFETIAPKKTDIAPGKSAQLTLDSNKPTKVPISEEPRKKIKISKRRKDDIQIKPKPESHVEILPGNIPSVTVTVPIPPSSAAAVAAATARSSEAMKYQMLAAATKNSADREMIEKAALERAAQAERDAAARFAAANNGSIVNSETPSVASYIRSNNSNVIHNSEGFSGPTFVTTTLASSAADNGINTTNMAARTTAAQPESYHSQLKFERTPQASHVSIGTASTQRDNSELSNPPTQLPQQVSHSQFGQSVPPSSASSTSPPSSQGVPSRSSSSPQPGEALTSSGGKLSHDDKKSKEKRITSSYWSVQEITQFPELLKEHGTNWENISKALGSKTTTMVRNYYVRGAATHTEWKELINMSANNHEADSVKSETTGQDPEAVKVAAPASAPASSTIKTENDMIPSSSHIGIHPSVISGQAKFVSGGASTSIHNITNTNSTPAVPTGSSLTETNPWSSTTTNGPPVVYFYSGSNKGDIPSSAPIQHPPPLQSTSAGTSYPHYAYNPIKNEVRQQPPVVAKSSFISQMTQPSEPLRPLTGSGITNTSSTTPVHKFNPIRMVSLLNDDPPEPPVSTHHSEYAPPRPLGHTSVASLLSTPSTTKNFSVSSIMNPSTSSSSYTPLSSGYTPFGANSSYTNNNPIPQPPKAASIRITSLLNSDDNESSDNNNRSSKSSIPFPRPIQSFAPPAPSPSAPSSASLQQPQYMQPFHPPRRPFADMLNPMPAPSFPAYSQSNSHVPNINNLVNNNLPKVGVTPTQNNPDNKNGDRYNNAGSNPLDALANAAFNNKQ